MTTEPAAETAAPAVEGPKPEGKGSSKVIPIILALAVGAGAAGSFPLWRAKLGLPAPEAGESFEVENLRAELSAATSRLAQLEARPIAPADTAPAAAPAENGRLTALEAAVKTLPTAEIESLSRQVAELKRNSADAAALLRLTDRVEQAEAALRELQAKRASAAALLLAVGQLREAALSGRPYAGEWRAARVLAGEDTESLALLENLREHAETGIAGRADLARRFDALAPAIIRAEMLPEADGWQRRTLDRLLSLVTIRRDDGVALGASAAALVGRAQAALNAGDAAGAVAELDRLSAGPAETARPWLEEAKARLAAETALSRLTAQSLALAGARP